MKYIQYPLGKIENSLMSTRTQSQNRRIVVVGQLIIWEEFTPPLLLKIIEIPHQREVLILKHA